MSADYRKLYRSSSSRMIAGVCGGLGEYAGIDPTLLRLIVVALGFVAGPATILAYLIAALLIPQAPTATI